MSTVAPRTLRAVLSAAGGGGDVRAALDGSGVAPDPGLAAALKREVDRLIYVDRAAASRVAEAAGWAAARLGDPASRAYADASSARVHHAEGRFREACALYERAADALARDGRRVEAAALAKQRVEALMLLGRHDEAGALARGARRTLRAAGERRLLAEHETNAGNLHYHRDRYRAALACYARAHEIFAELGDPTALALIDHNRGAVLFELGRLDEARRHYDRAGRAYRKLGLAVRAAQIDAAIAHLEHLRGRYREALRRFAAARAEGGVFNDVDAALTDLDLADVYLHLNAFPEARDAARRAADRFAAAGMPRELGTARRIEAAAAAGAGDVARGAAALAEAAAMLERAGHAPQAALARLDLARVHVRRGAAAEAVKAARSARAGLARTGLAAARRAALAVEARALLSVGDAAAARRLARATASEAARAGDERAEYQCHHVLADAERIAARPAPALDHYRRAVAVVERMRSRVIVDDFKSTFLDDKVELYEGAVRLCLEAGTPEAVGEAFRTLELSKSRSLADLLSEYAAGRGAGRARRARERFARLTDEVVWRRSRRDRAGARRGDGSRRAGAGSGASERRLAAAFRELQASDPAFAALRRPEPVAPDDLRALLAEDEALVELAPVEGDVWAFVATRDAFRAAGPLCTTDAVDRLMDGLLAQVESFVFGRAFAERQMDHLRGCADAYLAGLYDALLRPLEAELGERALVVVPHGRLHYLPVHALFDGERYVVERRAVSYAPSATVYAMCARRPGRAAGPPLICGIPAPDTPGIGREVAALGELFPDAETLVGDEATRAAFAASAAGRRIVHVAAHARFRADNPMLSSVAFADGELTFYDVFGLRLGADLVTLSGCDTGAIAVAAGDELHGLMRGFLYAGAPSLLLSLWPADDAATAEVMGAFYARVRAGDTKREALRSAQREVMRRHAHPYYWAPFALIGRAI